MGAVPALLDPYQLRLGQRSRELLGILGIQNLVLAPPYNQALLLYEGNAFADCIAAALDEGNVGLCPACTTRDLVWGSGVGSQHSSGPRGGRDKAATQRKCTRALSMLMH